MKIHYYYWHALALLVFANASPAQDPIPAAPEAVPATMIRFRTKVIEGPVAAVPPGAVIAPGALELRLKEIGDEKGWDIMSAPTVIAREGQEAKVEVGKEVLVAPGKKFAFAGIALTLMGKSVPEGKVQVVAHCVLTELAEGKADPALLLTFEQELDMPVTPGHTASLVVPTGDPGKFATFLITPERVDAAGKLLP